MPIARNFYAHATKTQWALHATSVQMYNIAGQSVYVGAGAACPNTTNGTISIDISHLSNGLYFLKVGNKTVKIIKN